MALKRVLLPRRVKAWIASALLVMLGFACVAQYYSADAAVDAVAVVAQLPGSASDDSVESFGGDSLGDGVLVTTLWPDESRPLAAFAPYYPESSYRLAFIGAPPRAPPLLRG